MRITVLSGAGISAESGLKTFRDSGGLWEGHDVMEVASPQGWQANPELVLDFYNQRRRQLLTSLPNSAHEAIASLEAKHEVSVVTQNIDDLHERGGSTNVIHLHGELFKVRCSRFHDDIRVWKEDLLMGQLSSNGHQLRPHIVWFGEDVPLIPKAAQIVSECDALIIVGTSMQVYPAAGLLNYAQRHAKVYFVDPNPAISSGGRTTVIAKPATEGIPIVVDLLG